MISALISQSRGLAVLDDGKILAVLADEDAQPRTVTEPEASLLLRGTHDLEALSLPGLSDLRAALHERCLREEALHAVLLLIDGQSSIALRATAAASVEHLISADPSAHPVVRWVEGVLMSVPAPPEVDFVGARALLRDRDVAALIRRVEAYQPRIRALFAAFGSVCRKLGVAARSALRRRAVEEGWFRALVLGERLMLEVSDEAWGLVEQWVSALVDMTSSHAVVVRPTTGPSSSTRGRERFDDAGWVAWPLPNDRDLPVAATGDSVLVEVFVGNDDRSHVAPEGRPASVLLEDLNLRSAERRLCEAALARSGSIIGAAQLLGITRHALKRRLLRHRIEWPSGMTIKPSDWTKFKVTIDRRGDVDQQDRRTRIRRSAFGRILKAKIAEN